MPQDVVFKYGLVIPHRNNTKRENSRNILLKLEAEACLSP
jgi:hypothetical protein